MDFALKPITKYFKYILLLSLLYLPIFGHLDSLTIRLWDESRQTMNAFEMYDNGEYFVTYCNGEPDMWNTKPPLLIWSQVVCIKMLGKNELAIRLPSALAALFTCLLLVYFSNRYFRNFWLGFIAALVLVTSWGYVHDHAIRTGDYDSLLTFFSVFATLIFYLYTEKGQSKYLYLFFFGITGAVLTKGIAGLFFVPACVAYALVRKKAIDILKSKSFYIGLLSFIVVVGGYYLIREIKNPGYINAVYMNELGGRFLDIKENNSSGFLFYYLNIKNEKLPYWLLFLPIGASLGLLNRDKSYFRFSLFLTLCVFIFFLVISFAKTKLYWYDTPLYPFFALFVAICISFGFDFFKNNDWFNNALKFNIVPYVFLFAIFFLPYSIIVKKVAPPTDNDMETCSICGFLREAIEGKRFLAGSSMLWDGYHVHIDCYTHILREKNIQVNFKQINEIHIGDTILVCQANMKQLLDKTYEYETITTRDYTIQCKILNKLSN